MTPVCESCLQAPGKVTVTVDGVTFHVCTRCKPATRKAAA